jgi:hypothetical protein
MKAEREGLLRLLALSAAHAINQQDAVRQACELVEKASSRIFSSACLSLEISYTEPM